MPTFVVEAAHGSEWEYIPPATGHIGGDPIELGGNRVSGDAHGADALRLGVRCELAGPCVSGGEPWARFLALAVVLDDSHAPSAGVSAPAATCAEPSASPSRPATRAAASTSAHSTSTAAGS